MGKNNKTNKKEAIKRSHVHANTRSHKNSQKRNINEVAHRSTVSDGTLLSPSFLSLATALGSVVVPPSVGPRYRSSFSFFCALLSH
jgi:hypothetical protein